MAGQSQPFLAALASLAMATVAIENDDLPAPSWVAPGRGEMTIPG